MERIILPRDQEFNVLSCTSGRGSRSFLGWLTELGFSGDMHSLRRRGRTLPNNAQEGSYRFQRMGVLECIYHKIPVH